MNVLDGLQVVEICEGRAGSIVGMFLADFGAEVIKVEPPGGDFLRIEPGFVAWNRGKKSVVVSPQNELDTAWLVSLIEGADVLISSTQNLTDGFKIDLERIGRNNPSLVHVRTPPFVGEPPWVGGRECNGLLAAALGVAWRQTSEIGRPVTQPVAAALLDVIATVRRLASQRAVQA